jgi:hypothetical protein
LKQRILLSFTAVLTLIAAVACISQAGAGADEVPIQKTLAPVMSHPSMGDMVAIENSRAILLTDDAGVSMSMHTFLLTPGHAYTAWWVVVNDPAACASIPCAPTDVLNNTDVVRAEVGFADGLVVDESGTADFAAYLPAGTMADGWFGHGLTNPRGAEIHIVIHDHGPLIPELAANMLTTYRGGCTDGSLPPTFPDFTKEFGQTGNNTCKMVQVVQFQQ